MGKQMLEGKVIFEKRYPKLDLSDMELEAANRHDPETEKLTMDEILDKMTSGMELVEMPHRQKAVKTFVNTAVQTAEIYEIDIKITQYDSHVTVDYYFDCSGCMGCLREVLVYADDISFFSGVEGHDITLSIDYYTHAVYRHGRKMLPMDWSLEANPDTQYYQ